MKRFIDVCFKKKKKKSLLSKSNDGILKWDIARIGADS